MTGPKPAGLIMRSLALLLAALLTVTPALASGGGGEHGGGEKKSDEKGSKRKLTQAESYIELDPVYTTVIDRDRPSGMLMVTFGIDIPDAHLREEAYHALPVLRDAYVRNLLAFTTTAIRLTRAPDVEEIAARLQRVTDRALGRKGAKILLAQVAMRVTR